MDLLHRNNFHLTLSLMAKCIKCFLILTNTHTLIFIICCFQFPVLLKPSEQKHWTDFRSDQIRVCQYSIGIQYKYINSTNIFCSEHVHIPNRYRNTAAVTKHTEKKHWIKDIYEINNKSIKADWLYLLRSQNQGQNAWKHKSETKGSF